MAHYRTTVESGATPEQAFELVADFSNILTWDPGIVSVQRLDDGPLAVGSRFRVVSAFGPRRIPLDYEVLEYDPPTRAVLQAGTRDFVSYDVITVAATPSGSAVTYDATLDLVGIRKLFDLAMTVAFQVVGRRAEAGIRRELNRLAP